MYFDCSENKNTLTVTPGHAAGYLHQDSCVTEDHDDQRQEEEARKGEHVVEGLLPVLDKTPMGGALGEVLRDCDGYIVKYKYLHEKTRRVLLSQRYIQISQTEREWILFMKLIRRFSSLVPGN